MALLVEEPEDIMIDPEVLARQALVAPTGRELRARRRPGSQNEGDDRRHGGSLRRGPAWCGAIALAALFWTAFVWLRIMARP